jgi:hypothetical protein
MNKWFSLNAGMEKAKAKKPMIVDFYFGKGCQDARHCKCYDNPMIAKIMDDSSIKIDLRKLSERKKNSATSITTKDCLLLFLDDKLILSRSLGKSLCFVNNVDQEWFVKYLDMIKASYSK